MVISWYSFPLLIGSGKWSQNYVNRALFISRLDNKETIYTHIGKIAVVRVRLQEMKGGLLVFPSGEVCQTVTATEFIDDHWADAVAA